MIFSAHIRGPRPANKTERAEYMKLVKHSGHETRRAVFFPTEGHSKMIFPVEGSLMVITWDRKNQRDHTP